MIDLHTHTDQSDGSLSPAELVRKACELKLEALAIADHDTLAGYDLAQPLAEKAGLELICAIELSTRPEATPGKRAPSVHLLGYFPGPWPTIEFRIWLDTQQEGRRRRNVALVKKLQSLGVAITMEEVKARGRNLTGRPHFAQVLMQKGYVQTRQEAFDVYLADHAQASVERDEPSLEEGIRQVRAAGGLPVLAHPVRLPEHEPEKLEAFLKPLIKVGLEGIEVYHSEHTPAHVACFSGLAERLGLVPTGGSDFHGSHKPSVHLGTGIRNNLCIPYSILEEMRAAHTAVRKAS